MSTAAGTLREAWPRVPALAITLGSGLGALVEALEDPVPVPFAALPPLPVPSVEGHGGRFVFGRLQGVDVVLQAGRVHAYEGHGPEVVAAPVHLLADLGVRVLLLTNAAGGIRPGVHPGDLILLDDQIDLSFRSPLAGPVRGRQPRFPDMSAPFDPDLQRLLRRAASAEGLALPTGTYAGVHGPSYETRAEVRMLARLGADVVGMSTVSEVIVARARGLRVAGLTLVTNRATGLAAEPLAHGEVLEIGRQALGRMTRILRAATPLLAGASARQPSDGGTGAK